MHFLILMMIILDGAYFMLQPSHVKNQFKYVVCHFTNFTLHMIALL